MWKTLAIQLRKLNESASKLFSKINQNRVRKYVPDQVFALDMMNYGVFPLLDFLDEVRAMPKYKRTRRTIFWGIIGMTTAYLGFKVWKISTYLLWVETQDPRAVKMSSDKLVSVIDKFVLHNDYIMTMLGSILSDNVFQSDRITLTLARTLGRTVTNDGIKAKSLYSD